VPHCSLKSRVHFHVLNSWMRSRSHTEKLLRNSSDGSEFCRLLVLIQRKAECMLWGGKTLLEVKGTLFFLLLMMQSQQLHGYLHVLSRRGWSDVCWCIGIHKIRKATRDCLKHSTVFQCRRNAVLLSWYHTDDESYWCVARQQADVSQLMCIWGRTSPFCGTSTEY
jgi:hypothetical protein